MLSTKQNLAMSDGTNKSCGRNLNFKYRTYCVKIFLIKRIYFLFSMTFRTWENNLMLWKCEKIAQFVIPPFRTRPVFSHRWNCYPQCTKIPIVIIISLLTADGIYSRLFMAPVSVVVQNNRNKKDKGINEKIGRYYGHNIMNRKKWQ